MTFPLKSAVLLSSAILATVCVFSCTSSEVRDVSKKDSPQTETAPIATQEKAAGVHSSSLADSAVQAIKQRQTPLFNPSSFPIEWHEGPVIQTQYGYLFEPLMSEIRRRMDSLNKSIPKWDGFLTIRENQKKYDDIVLSWEQDMLQLLSNTTYAQLHVIEANEVQLYFTNTLVGPQFDVAKAARRHFARKSPQGAQCTEIWLGKCSGYTADLRLLCLQLLDVQTATHESGEFRREIGDLSCFGDDRFDLPKVPAEEARALFSRDSASVVLEVYWDKPVILYHRRHSIYWDNRNYYQPNSIDWTIDVWILTHLSLGRAFGYNLANGGKTDSLVHVTDLNYTKCKARLQQGLRFSSDKQDATPS